jgi:hypothetical protein
VVVVGTYLLVAASVAAVVETVVVLHSWACLVVESVAVQPQVKASLVVLRMDAA